MRRSALQQSVDDALVAVCRGDLPKLDEAPGLDDEMAAAARYHRVAPLVHVALRESRPDIAAVLKEDRSRALMNHLRSSALLGGVAAALEGIDWLAFKGPLLSEFAHPIPGLRFYKDLDLLVSPSQFRETCKRLMDSDWRILMSDESLLSDELPGEVPLVNEAGIVMDLHWSMVVMRSVRQRFDVTADALLARRGPVSIGPVKLWALSPADALVHVCQHAALIGATKLGHVLDADQLARGISDWDDVIRRAQAWGAGVQTAAVLGRSRRLLGTPMPADIESRLGLGPGMRRLLPAVDRRLPIQRLRQDESWVRLVTRGLQPSLAATAGSVIARMARGVFNRAATTRPNTPRVSASARVIDTYLTRVETAARA